MRLKKEGNRVIPLLGILVVSLYYLLFSLVPVLIVQLILAIIAICFLVLVVRFFRNPIRHCPAEKGVVYAPCDGRVVVVEETYESEYLKENRIQISIFMSPLNVHVNRSPITGMIEYFKYHKGKYLVAWHPKSSTENERTTVCIQTAEGTKILMRQIAGAVARRIFFYPKINDLANAGEAIGFIRFGSRVDIFLPTDADISVKIGDQPVAGETPLAIIP